MISLPVCHLLDRFVQPINSTDSLFTQLLECALMCTSLFLFLFTLQEEFLSLCVDKLTEILASDFLNVPKEEMVFEAAMLWLNKCLSRKQSFEKVSFPKTRHFSFSSFLSVLVLL